MNITVYCGANTGANAHYTEAARNLGRWIAEKGHTLVYGGGKVGLMGTIADEVLLHNREVIGVIPTFLEERELSHPHLTRLEVVHSMSERKNRMIALGKCYIALPGGVGTLEEMIEVISWARLEQHANPCIFLNVDHYYDKLREFFELMVANDFLSEGDQQLVLFAESIEEIEAILRQPTRYIKRKMKKSTLQQEGAVFNTITDLLVANRYPTDNALVNEANLMYQYYCELESGGHESLLNWQAEEILAEGIEHYLEVLTTALKKIGATDYAAILETYGIRLWMYHKAVETGAMDEEPFYEIVQQANKEYYALNDAIRKLIEQHFNDIHTEFIEFS